MYFLCAAPAEDIIRALVKIGGFKQEQFFITDNIGTNEYTVKMYGSQESVESVKVFLQAPVPKREDDSEKLRRDAKQSAARVRLFWSLTR